MKSMLVKLVLVGLLATSSVFASAIKGEEPKALKGVERLVSSPVEYQRRSELSSKTSEPKVEQQQLSKTQERDEQQQLAAEQLKVDVEQREEQQLISQEELPSKTLRYEAKPQIEQQHYESTKELAPVKAPAAAAPKKEEAKLVYEQQRVEAASYEQLQQQQLREQVELRDYEQRKLEDQQVAAIQLQQQQQQQQFEEQRQIAVKGASKEPIAVQAPLQSAEPEPYAFEYAIEGSSRRESGDAQGVVRGQYTLQQPDGTSRVVDYVADRNGFRAQVNSNEFGTEGQAPLAAPTVAAVKGAPPAAVKGAPLAATQLPELKQEQLKQEIAYVEEAPRAAVKGAKLPEQQAEVKAPAKGQQQEPLKSLEEPAAPVQAELATPVVKSAELRSPKALGASPKTRSGFESATAHRSPVVGVLRHEYAHSQVIREAPLVHHQPAVRHHAVVAPARQYVVRPVAPAGHHLRHQPSAAASLLRSQLQHDRYLPTPIQTINRAPANPRAISFYSNNNNAETSEDLPIGFERSA